MIGVETQYAYHDVAAHGEPSVDPVFEQIDLAFLVPAGQTRKPN